jgi:DNA anti-recombination protein RmuC
MHDIIYELLEIDADARKLTDEAQAKRRDVRRIIAERTAELRKRYQKEAEERLMSFKAAGSESAERIIAQVRDKSSRRVAALRDAASQNGDKWADAIYRAVIGRE